MESLSLKFFKQRIGGAACRESCVNTRIERHVCVVDRGGQATTERRRHSTGGH